MAYASDDRGQRLLFRPPCRAPNADIGLLVSVRQDRQGRAIRSGPGDTFSLSFQPSCPIWRRLGLGIDSSVRPQKTLNRQATQENLNASDYGATPLPPLLL